MAQQISSRMSSMIGKTIDVLLVEDSADDVFLTRETLRESKLYLNLHVARDGVEALDFLYRRGPHAAAPRPDLILLDLNLPRVNGRQVLAEIKEDPSLRAIPVVVLTVSQDEADVLAAYSLHANCYIAKPLDLDQFIKVVQAIQEFWLTIVKLPPVVC
jgi:chemotaxis family two-component system response regulator Rcp1